MADMTVLVRPQVVTGPRGRLVERRACFYCWASFTQTRAGQEHCSAECSKRTSVWDAWVRDTREAAILGSVGSPIKTGPALPPAGRSLFDAIASSEVGAELEQVA